ncbi:MAG: diaminopimelate epimerase [Phycisphaerales bacterium]
MRFTKMHGLGNDYVYVDALTEPALEHMDWPALAIELSDRHTGIGGDGVILICPPRHDINHARMRTFNADGSESDACGNGTRCVARFARERLGMRTATLRIESGRRVLQCEPLEDGRACVDMGTPGLALADCHVDASSLRSQGPPSIDVEGSLLVFSAVSMGNPHAVAFASDNRWLGEDLAAESRRLGPVIEHHPAFTERTNAHLVRIVSRAHAIVHTWERGSGPTRACGTGACAVLVAGVLAGLLDHEAVLSLPGGDLRVSWKPESAGGDGVVRQTGPATFVFDGDWSRSPAAMLSP